MVDKEAERFTLVPLVLQPVETLIRDDIGHIPLFTHSVVCLRYKIRIIVVALSRQNLPEIKTRRQCFEMPFSHNSRLVTCLLQQFGHRLLSPVKLASRIIGKSVFMTEFSRQHASPAGTAERISDKTVGKSHPLTRYTVEMGSLYKTRIITTHHLGRMVVGHDIYDIQQFLLLLFLALARSGNPQYSKRCCGVK